MCPFLRPATQLMRPYLDPKKEEEVCVFPEVGYGLIETKVINSDAAVDPKNVVLTMANEGALTVIGPPGELSEFV